MLLTNRASPETSDTRPDMTAGAAPLRSHFTPGYGVALNLLKNKSLDEAKALVAKSFETVVEVKKKYWVDFMRLISVLQSEVFLDENYKLTNLGSLGAKINSENELQMSHVLLEMSRQKLLSANNLAAVIAGTFEEKRNRGLGSLPEYLEHLYEKFSEICSKVESAQREQSLCMPVNCSAKNMIVVEDWANDCKGSWLFCSGNYHIADGDACGLFRRVLDILRQIPGLPEIGGKLGPLAKNVDERRW